MPDNNADFGILIVSLLAFLAAGAVSFASTPLVRMLAEKIGAIDVPRDARRMHKKPIPRLGGLAIFFGFLFAILLFGRIDHQTRGILLGAVIIVVLGVIDDSHPLGPKLKFAVQVAAALMPVLHGVVIERFSNPNIFSDNPYINLGVLSIPLTIVWIVGITNAVNLIDGLDGLAIGVSSIACFSLFAIAVMVSEPFVAIIMAALAGACIGFMPYYLNPARMFMGDTGATFLGYMLAVVSIQGLFKFYAVVSFAVPFLILGLPIFDTLYAIVRRLRHGQNPMKPDRGHVHHRLIDMGFSQKQSVAILYAMSGILGLSAVVLTTSGELKAMLLLIAVIVAAMIGVRVVAGNMFSGAGRAQDGPGSEAQEEAPPQDGAENETPEESEKNEED